MRKALKVCVLCLVAVLLITTFSLAGCKATATETTAAAETAASKQWKFAYIIPSFEANWYNRIVEGFQMGAKEVGADVMVLNSEYNVDKEVANIDLAVAQKVDGIGMFSFNETGAPLAVKKGAEAGIPVVSCDSVAQATTRGFDNVANVDFNWTQMGEIYAQWMADNYPGEDFVIIAGALSHLPVIMVNESMKANSEKLGKNKLLDIRGTDYDSTKAAAAMEDLLNSGLKFKVVFVMMEEMAAAVCRVLDQKGVLNNPIVVISQNGQPLGLDLIRNGDMQFTISTSPGWEGYVAFREMWSFVNGKNKDKSRQMWLPLMPVDKKVLELNDKTKVIPWDMDPIFLDLTRKYFPELMW
jgi:ribose transport system substrate-binding protein